jgi:hypothetical protein
MKIIPQALLALTLAVIATNGNASQPSTEEQVDANVKELVVAQRRVLTRAAAFCTASGRSLNQRLESYIDAFSTGTKAGMIEVSKTDKNILRPAPGYTKTDLEMMDKQGDVFLKGVQMNPDLGCKKLADFLGSGTMAAFKESTLQSHREYSAKRAAYCASVPKPQSCE